VGRTARAGKTGQSLNLLLPHETPYIEFLRLKQVPLVPYEKEKEKGDGDGGASSEDVEGRRRRRRKEEALELLDGVKKLSMKDRDVLEKGTRAFTSFIRAYKEHRRQVRRSGGRSGWGSCFEMIMMIRFCC